MRRGGSLDAKDAPVRLEKKMKNTLYFIALALLFASASGCSVEVDGHYPLSGKVNFGGAPLASGQISFQPASENASSSSAAQVVDGKYEISADKGLVPGEYSVVLRVTEGTGKKIQAIDADGQPYEYEETVSYVPEDWGTHSTHTVVVEPKKNVLDFDIPRSDEPVDEPEPSGNPGI